jgi:hypothetical protein
MGGVGGATAAQPSGTARRAGDSPLVTQDGPVDLGLGITGAVAEGPAPCRSPASRSSWPPSPSRAGRGTHADSRPLTHRRHEHTPFGWFEEYAGVTEDPPNTGPHACVVPGDPIRRAGSDRPEAGSAS